MTANQIAYLTYKEAERANRAKELETNRTNLVNEDLKRTQNYLTSRQLNLDSRKLAETQRHNIATEDFDQIRAYDQVSQTAIKRGQLELERIMLPYQQSESVARANASNTNAAFNMAGVHLRNEQTQTESLKQFGQQQTNTNLVLAGNKAAMENYMLGQEMKSPMYRDDGWGSVYRWADATLGTVGQMFKGNVKLSYPFSVVRITGGGPETGIFKHRR